MITYAAPTPDIITATWVQFGDRLTILQNYGEMYLSWNGPLYSPPEVIEAPRLLGHFRAARAEFDGDKRPEVGLLYRQFDAIITAIMEGVQTA